MSLSICSALGRWHGPGTGNYSAVLISVFLVCLFVLPSISSYCFLYCFISYFFRNDWFYYFRSYLVYYFDVFALAPRQKLSVEFRHVIRNASKNLAKTGERSVFTLGSLCLLCCVRDAAWSWFDFFFFIYFFKLFIFAPCSLYTRTYIHTFSIKKGENIKKHITHVSIQSKVVYIK